jgi:hypothetical protein
MIRLSHGLLTSKFLEFLAKDLIVYDLGDKSF